MNNNHGEEIILESRDVIEQLVPPSGRNREVQHTLCCQGNAKNTRIHYRLLNDYFVEIVQEQTKTQPSSKKVIIAFHVGFFKSKPLWSLTAVAWWFYGAVIFLAVFGILYLVMPNLYGMIGAAALFSMCLFFYIKSIHVQRLFVTRIAKAPLLKIPHRDLPGQEGKLFIEQMKKAIDSYPLPYNINPLAEETKLLRASQERGIFTEKEYKKYRDLILQRYNR